MNKNDKLVDFSNIKPLNSKDFKKLMNNGNKIDINKIKKADVNSNSFYFDEN